MQLANYAIISRISNRGFPFSFFFADICQNFSEFKIYVAHLGSPVCLRVCDCVRKLYVRKCSGIDNNIDCRCTKLARFTAARPTFESLSAPLPDDQ